MTIGLIWAIIGLGIGWCVTRFIENKDNNSKFIYLVMAAAIVGLVFFLRMGKVI